MEKVTVILQAMKWKTINHSSPKFIFVGYLKATQLYIFDEAISFEEKLMLSYALKRSGCSHKP